MSDSSLAPADPRVLANGPAPIIEQAPQPQIVISERAVMLGTAAAASPPHEKSSHNVIAVLHEIFHHHPDGGPHATHHHPHYPPRLDVVLEHAAMEREMHRL